MDPAKDKNMAKAPKGEADNGAEAPAKAKAPAKKSAPKMAAAVPAPAAAPAPAINLALGKPPKTYKDARAALQKFLMGGEHHGISFTQGAAEYLAERAAKTILAAPVARGVPGRVEAAAHSFDGVATRLGDAADGATRLDKRTVQRLRESEKFCGIAPWC